VNRVKNWKIGTRITAGFAAVMLIAAALGLFAVNRAGEIGKRTDELSSNYFPSVIALSAVKSNMHQAVSDLIQLVDSTDPAVIAKLDAEIASLRADSKKDLDFYESTPFTPEEAKAYAEFQETRKGFWKDFEEVQRQGQSTDPVEIAKAQKVLTSQMKPLYDKDGAEIDQLVEMNKKGAKAGMALIGDATAASKRGILIGLLLALAASIPITLYIVRGITGPLARAVRTLDQVAGGDLTASLDLDSQDEMGRMASSLNAAVAKIRSTLLGVAAGAADTDSSARQLAEAVRDLATGAQEQAASIEETSASLEQITATIRQSADNAKQANQLAAGSRESAEKGQEVVAGAVGAMAEINASSSKISEIISTIDEIAFQTNLLAVNAAIEAARAGEDGRGFAVVATEVRSLAQRSADAAKEIKSLIQDSLRKVERGSDLVSKSGETLKGIVGAVKRVTDMVGEIASASAEQSIGVNQVNTAVNQMDHVTQTNAAQTEELSATAGSLAEQAQRLQKLVGEFTLGDAAGGRSAPVRKPASRPAGQRPRAESRPSAPGARSVVAARAAAPHRAAGAEGKHSAGSALAAAGSSSEDNFEEF